MPPRTVVLPVKCSTVKNITSKLEKAIWYEIIIASITNLLYDLSIYNEIVRGVSVFSTWGGSRVADHAQYPLTTLDHTLIITTFISLVVVCFVFVAPATKAILHGIVENWPRLECIKDEPEEP